MLRQFRLFSLSAHIYSALVGFRHLLSSHILIPRGDIDILEEQAAISVEM
jgi:hypothetical protein